MGGINFSPILFILSKKLYLCIKQELFGRIATQFTEFMTVAKSLPRSLRNTYKLLISNSFLFIYRILLKKNSYCRYFTASKIVSLKVGCECMIDRKSFIVPEKYINETIS